MIEGFEPNAVVLLNLVSPKEKFFGVLRSLSAAGNGVLIELSEKIAE